MQFLQIRMNLSTREFSNKDVKLIIPNKVTTLNPNAAEFVPSALRSPFGNKNADPTRFDVPGSSGEVVLDHSESRVATNSDDEALQYWRHQLPDDITPDFKVTGQDELQTPEDLSLAGLLLNNGMESSKSSPFPASQSMGSGEDAYVRSFDSLNLTEKTGYPVTRLTTFAEDRLSSTLMPIVSSNRDRQFISGYDQFTNQREGHLYDVDSKSGFSNALLSEHVVAENIGFSPLEMLASQFPGVSTKYLADVYYVNGCDLNSTIEMLTKLELRDVLCQNLSSKALASPSLTTLDLPAFPMAEFHNGEDLRLALSPYKSPSSRSRGTIDFPAPIQNLASQDSAHWKFERNCFADGTVGSSRRSQPVTSSYNRNGKSFLRDNLQSFGGTPIPAWLDNGEVLESREEAHDLARLQDLFLEQAWKARLIGSKPLAKEPSGNLHGMQMRATHGKARETIYQQSIPVASETEGYIRGQNPLIDLHGLHVTEAMHVLKHELSILRSTARSARQRLQVMVYVGAGQHAKSSRIPARLPLAVEQYLLEEGLPYTQPQPGLLRIVIY